MSSDLSFFCAPRLSEEQAALWRDFARRVPWAHYRQDPAWAETERSGRGMAARKPWFFWAEAQEGLCLTAIGVRRRLPVPGRVFWEFNKGPNFVDVTVLDEWLSWLLPRIRHGAARLRVGPAIPLDRGGEDVEAILKRRGFACISEWATLLVDISGNEDEIMAGFRPATQRSIKKSRRLGIEIHSEDTPDGWGAIAALQTELSRTSATPPVDAPAIERVSRHWLRGGPEGPFWSRDMMARRWRRSCWSPIAVRPTHRLSRPRIGTEGSRRLTFSYGRRCAGQNSTDVRRSTS